MPLWAFCIALKAHGVLGKIHEVTPDQKNWKFSEKSKEPELHINGQITIHMMPFKKRSLKELWYMFENVFIRIWYLDTMRLKKGKGITQGINHRECNNVTEERTWDIANPLFSSQCRHVQHVSWEVEVVVSLLEAAF